VHPGKVPLNLRIFRGIARPSTERLAPQPTSLPVAGYSSVTKPRVRYDEVVELDRRQQLREGMMRFLMIALIALLITATASAAEEDLRAPIELPPTCGARSSNTCAITWIRSTM
jgi:hypothetical protein